TLEYELFEGARRSTRGVELIIVAALHLGAIQRDARGLQKARCVASILWINTDTDTARDEDLLVFEKKRLLERLFDRARGVGCILGARDLRQQDRKLVATKASYSVALAHAAYETLGH